MDDDFTVTLMFPDEYRDFIAEICYKGECVCTITQEFGPLEFSVEFEKTSNQVPLTSFLDTLQYAQTRLYNLREQKA